MERKISSSGFWKNHYIMTYIYNEILKCVIPRRNEKKKNIIRTKEELII